MCKMSHLVSEYHKYFTNFAIHDNKTPAGDTGNMDMLDPPRSGKKKRRHKKKHKRNPSMLYSIVNIPCMYELTLCGFLL